jgi:hypothetical protein
MIVICIGACLVILLGLWLERRGRYERERQVAIAVRRAEQEIDEVFREAAFRMTAVARVRRDPYGFNLTSNWRDVL